MTDKLLFFYIFIVYWPVLRICLESNNLCIRSRHSYSSQHLARSTPRPWRKHQTDTPSSEGREFWHSHRKPSPFRSPWGTDFDGQNSQKRENPSLWIGKTRKCVQHPAHIQPWAGPPDIRRKTTWLGISFLGHQNQRLDLENRYFGAPQSTTKTNVILEELTARFLSVFKASVRLQKRAPA